MSAFAVKSDMVSKTEDADHRPLADGKFHNFRYASCRLYAQARTDKESVEIYPVGN